LFVVVGCWQITLLLVLGLGLVEAKQVFQVTARGNQLLRLAKSLLRGILVD
jgi:hypothetical protein